MAYNVLSPWLAVSRKYHCVWCIGYEVSIRSAYQRELIKISRSPVLADQGSDGDSVGIEIARCHPKLLERKVGRWLDRFGALVFPRCATHKKVRVALISDTDRHECPRCREELGLL